MYSKGMWHRRLTTSSGSCGRHTTNNIAKGLNSMQDASHTISTHVGINTTCSSIIVTVRRMGFYSTLLHEICEASHCTPRFRQLVLNYAI